jgi:hypothetical protein
MFNAPERLPDAGWSMAFVLIPHIRNTTQGRYVRMRTGFPQGLRGGVALERETRARKTGVRGGASGNRNER